MLEKYKIYLTKKNICLVSVVIICMILILYIALNMIFPDYDLSKIEKGAAKNVVEDFVYDICKKDKLKIEDYMVEGWDKKQAKNLFIGSEDLESLEIENIKNDSYSQYSERYIKNRKKKGKEVNGEKYTSFTVDLKHKYKKDSSYKNETKKIVFLLEKKDGNWRILTLGTRGIIDSLI